MHNRLKRQLIREQQYLSGERNSTEGTVKRRGNSASQLRTNTNNNNSKINKSNAENNKTGNKTNRSQSSKKRSSLKINTDFENNSKKKKETTTKINTAV